MDFILSLFFADDAPGPNFSNVPGAREEIRLTSARISGIELLVKQILPNLPFSDERWQLQS